MNEAQAPAYVSVTKTEKTPLWMYTLQGDDRLIPVLPEEERVTRRQDAAPTYVLNGAVSVAKTEWLAEHKSFMHHATVAYVMPSGRSVDIDDEMDMQIAETITTTD